MAKTLAELCAVLLNGSLNLSKITIPLPVGGNLQLYGLIADGLLC
jgi:hypothetical protein